MQSIARVRIKRRQLFQVSNLTRNSVQGTPIHTKRSQVCELIAYLFGQHVQRKSNKRQRTVKHVLNAKVRVTYVNLVK